MVMRRTNFLLFEPASAQIYLAAAVPIDAASEALARALLDARRARCSRNMQAVEKKILLNRGYSHDVVLDNGIKERVKSFHVHYVRLCSTHR